MKNKITISLFVLGLFFGSPLFAQSEWCGTDMLLEQYFKTNPEAEQQFKKEAYLTPEQLAAGEKSTNKIIIPLVVHVIHYEGDGNISKAQIESGIQQLNEDFSKLNADTSSIRSQFRGIAANANIEFRLAQLDPNGNCTEGITRHSDLTTYSPQNINAPKFLVQWDPYSYMNVWIVNSIFSGPGSGVIGGFAQFPFPSGGPASTFGLVVRHNEWGTIGTATNSNFGGRAVTHEIGHCLNLFHPFQSGCGSNCSSSGDFVCDTPPQASSNNNSCNFNLNTCSNDASGGNAANPNPYSTDVPDQLENFMGYGIGCQVMFTEGQNARMRAAINAYEILDSLRTPYNLIQTGTNDNYTAPPCLPKLSVADIHKFGCIDDSITFTEENWGGVIQSYNWSFPGGSPSTSTAATPKVSYANAGTYDVVLRVSNARGTDSLVLNNYVTVSPDTGYSAATYFETFEDASRFANDWTTLKLSPGSTWELSTFVGKGGSSQSMWIRNRTAQRVGNRDAFVSPAIDLTALANPTISFDIAYSRTQANSNDKLRLYISDDCGENWSLLINAPPSFIAFDNTNRASDFLPQDDTEWKEIFLPSSSIPNRYKSSTNVRFMFDLEHGGGNNMYIDNFTLNNTLTGIKQYKQIVSNFNVFPNPAKEEVTIKVDIANDDEQASIYLTDMLGKRVANIFDGQMRNTVYTFNVDLSQYAPGIYFVTVQTSTERSTQKLIVR